MRVEMWKIFKVLCIRIHLLQRYGNERITKVELCELQSDIVEYWVLSVWLWVDGSLLITFELQTFVYLCSGHFTKLSKFYTYV
jgi:hypothetical protein